MVLVFAAQLIRRVHKTFEGAELTDICPTGSSAGEIRLLVFTLVALVICLSIELQLISRL